MGHGALVNNCDGRRKCRDECDRELGGRAGELGDTSKDQHRRQRAGPRARRHEQRGNRDFKRNPGDSRVNSIRIEAAARACRNLQGHAQRDECKCADQEA